MVSLAEQKDLLRKQYVNFRIGQEEYGIDIGQSREILKPGKITNVPNSADYIAGVINLRGQIIPVVNLRKRLNIEGKVTGEDARIITVEVREALIGLLVDEVNEVMWFDEVDIDPAPEVAGDIRQEFLKGVATIDDSLLILIDLERLLFE